MKTKLLLTICAFYASLVFGQFGPQQVISTTTERPYISIPFDIDNDGYIDLLSTGLEDHKMTWYKNLDGNGNFGPKIILNEIGAYYLSIDFVDIDSDGDMDIYFLGNNPRKVAWLENLDGMGTFSTEHVLLNNQPPYINYITMNDIDQDGDPDLLVTYTNTFNGWIVWHENTDGQGNFGAENLLIDGDTDFLNPILVDIDNDGMLDILTSKESYNPSRVVWYKNLGNGNFSTERIIYEFLAFSSDWTSIWDLQYIDINTDGKKDIVINTYADFVGVQTLWIENLDEQGNFGDLHGIQDIYSGYTFYDLDNDSDNDILIWDRDLDIISWRENIDGLGTFGPDQTITTDVDFPRDAKAADIDGDGVIDIVSASISDNKVAWYKNNLLGIPENTLQQFTLFPNPTSGILYLRSTSEIVSVEILNLVGQKVAQFKNTSEIDLSNQSSGIYLLKIISENGASEVQKIIKK